MAYSNRIRLPVQLHSAQFPEERSVFRKANGVTKTLFAVIRHTYEVETDFMSEIMHRRFTIALSHDNIQWEGDRFLGGVVKDGDYNIQWPEGVLHYPTAKAECKVQVTPFDATNSNCQTCEEASQLDLTDDTVTALYGNPLQEDTDYSASLADNDTICCYPAVFSLISFNSDYLTTASINPGTGVLSIHTGDDLVDAVGIKIATYRVTCPNGGYDEADVYADFDGSIAGCLAPTDVEATDISPTIANITWTESAPGSDYYWELYEGSGPIGTPVQTGTVTGSSVTPTGLTPNTEYYFQIRTVCYGSTSAFVSETFSTIPETDTCGMYNVAFDDGTGVPSHSKLIEYRDCNFVLEYRPVFNNSSIIICTYQTAPGVPSHIVGMGGSSGLTITYLGLC